MLLATSPRAKSAFLPSSRIAGIMSVDFSVCGLSEPGQPFLARLWEPDDEDFTFWFVALLER